MRRGGPYRVVLMLSVGVTASSDSVTPAPKPARTVRGPDSLPFSSARRLLNWSNATNPSTCVRTCHHTASCRIACVRIPALAALPMMSVVHPAYHCVPNGGHGSFWPSASRLLSCDLVFATAMYLVSGSVAEARGCGSSDIKEVAVRTHIRRDM